jgi:hypothetical protein
MWGADWCREPLWRRAGEIPSWHIAPARAGTVTDLISGSQIVTFTNSSPAWGFNSSGVLVQPTANVPFIEYDPATGACLGWRVWDGVTNSLVQSQDFATTWTNNNLTVNTNTVTAPDGTLTADTFGPVVGDGLTATRSLRQNPALTAQGTYTLSVFVKIGTATANGIALYVSDQNGANQFRSNYNLFSLTTSTLAVTWAAPSAYIIPCANGWYRCVLTGVTSTAHTGLRVIIYLNAFGTISDSYGTHHIWGAQLNPGALAPYVPTGALTASSTADVASITGAAFARIWNASQGTIFADFGPYANSGGSFNPGILQFDNNTTANIIRLFAGGSVAPVFNVIDASVAQAYLSTTAISPSSTSRIAAAYNLNDFARAVNGATPETDAVGTVPTVTQMLIGNGTAGVNRLNGYIRELAIFRSRRNNRDLILLTQ